MLIFGEWSPPGDGIFSAGRTSRDLNTLAKALSMSCSFGTILASHISNYTKTLSNCSNINLIEVGDQPPHLE